MSNQIGTVLDKDQNSKVLTLKITNTAMTELLSLAMDSRGEGRYLSRVITGLPGTTANPIEYFSYIQDSDGNNSPGDSFWWDGSKIIERSPAAATTSPGTGGTGGTTIIYQGARDRSTVVPYTGGVVYQPKIKYTSRLAPNQDKIRNGKFAGV